jgi:MFS family permease
MPSSTRNLVAAHPSRDRPVVVETLEADTEPLYHLISRQQKWNLVFFTSLAGSFSPLSSNIYFPAIATISHDLSASPNLVALTITVYMIVQGIAPSIFAVFSDAYGRRLTFTVSLLIYTAANLGLAFVPNVATLMVLRGLQAAGSAATISISAGVIADIASPSERGGFMGTNAGVRYVTWCSDSSNI